MRILIIKTSSMGDVVHNLPIIADIKKQFPDALIDWVVEENFVEILSMHPQINQIIPVALRRWRKSIFAKKTWGEFRVFKQQLQSQPYDIVIDTQGLLKSGLITYLSNSDNKCGYDKNSVRESLASRFYHHKFNISYQQHAVLRCRALAALSLQFTPPITAPDYGVQAPNDLNLILGAQELLNKPFILGLHGTSRDSKLWHTEHWIQLGKQLQKKQLHLLLPWSNEVEFKRARHIADALQNATVLPKLNITALAMIISKSLAVVGMDTGLSHLAAALNKHVIAIYTDTNPALTGVMAGANTCVNLGGKNQEPLPQEIMLQLNLLNIIPHA